MNKSNLALEKLCLGRKSKALSATPTALMPLTDTGAQVWFLYYNDVAKLNFKNNLPRSLPVISPS